MDLMNTKQNRHIIVVRRFDKIPVIKISKMGRHSFIYYMEDDRLNTQSQHGNE